MFKKLFYIPKMIEVLYDSAVNNDFYGIFDNCGCYLTGKGHRLYASEIWDILGPFNKENGPKINSWKKLLWIKELIWNLKAIRNHERGLIEEHKEANFKNKEKSFCNVMIQEHIQQVESWNKILGPWQ